MTLSVWGRLARHFRADFVSEPWPEIKEPAPTDRQQLAEHARRLLEDPVLRLALERIQTDLTARWRQTQTGDTRGREAAYRMWWAVEEFRGELRKMIGASRINRN